MSLRILQYNVQKSVDKVMIPVLEGPHLPYDIIAIQEPWINGRINATYCPRAIKYHLIYPALGHARTCIYINKQIPLSRWHAVPHQTTAVCESTWTQDQSQSITCIVRHLIQSRL